MMSQWHRHLIPSSLTSIVGITAALLPLLVDSLLLVHKDDISREQLKELLYEEIMSFRPTINEG